MSAHHHFNTFHCKTTGSSILASVDIWIENVHCIFSSHHRSNTILRVITEQHLDSSKEEFCSHFYIVTASYAKFKIKSTIPKYFIQNVRMTYWR